MQLRSGFTKVELVVALFVLIVGFVGIAGGISGAREAARRNSCVCHGKQIGLTIHNYHHVHRRFPNTTTTRIRKVRPGCARPLDDADVAGYSWQTKTLPYIEEMTLYNKIADASNNFARPAFDPSMKITTSESATIHPAHSAFGFYRCPSYSGPKFSDAPEYRELGGVEGSTYVAMSATTYDRLIDPSDEAAEGMICPAPQIVTFQDVADGTSKTILWCETREPRYASWYDGTVAWTVGADPHGGNATAMNNDDGNRAQPFLTKQRHGAIETDWQWGPSSEHRGGIVMHGIGDGSVKSLTTDIDLHVYLALITRAGKEEVRLPE